MQGITKTDFRLLRLILLDSYSPGGEAIIDLSDGAILTGDNGAGKTSLLSLIPIFYGENPGQCTSGSSSFADFYLPHSTSYVIFEYERRNIPCMSILYSAGEAGFNYRFIRAAYDLSLFTEEGDGTNLISARDLKVRLKTVGVPHSHVLALSEYRNIIQGRVAGGKTSAENRALVADYSFTASGSRLVHIEKIVSGMFTRKANFDEFLRVIVDYISNDGNTPISITGDREQYAEWPAQFAAYNEVMQHADLMKEVDEIDAKLKANGHELSCLHGKLLVLGQHYASQEKRLRKDQTQWADIREHEQSKFNESLLELQGKESKADADANEAESRVKSIDAKAKQYEDDAITEKAELVDSLLQMRANLESLNDRKEALLGESSKIEQKYQSMGIDVEKKHLACVQQLNKDMEKIRGQFELLLDQNRTEHQGADRLLQETAEAGLKAMREEHHQAIKQEAHWNSIVVNPAAAPVAVEALEKKQGEIEVLREKMRFTQGGRSTLETRKTQVGREYVEQELVLKGLRRRIEEIEANHQKLLNHLNPDKNSLLHFLRTNKPDWPADIAKVIREDVLTMNGLSPSIEGVAGSLYGVSLELSRLDSNLCSDEVALQVQIATCRNDQEKLQKEIGEAEKSLEQCNKRRKAADDALMLHDAEIAKLIAHETILKTEEAAAKQAVDGSKKKIRQDAEQNLANAQESVNVCNQKIIDANAALATARQMCAKKHENIEKSLKQEQAVKFNSVQTAIKQADKAKDQQLNALAKEKLKALSEKGVDTAMLQGIDLEIGKQGEDIRTAEGWIERVNAWRFWRENEFPKRAKQDEIAKACRKEQQTFSGKKATLSRQWATRQQEIQAKMNDLESRLSDSVRDQTHIANKVADLSDFPADQDIVKQPFDTSWSVANLFGQAINLFANRKNLRGELISRIRMIKASFSNVRGSPTEQYFSTTRAAVDPDDSNPSAWVKPLHDWFSREHEARRHILMMQARAYGSLISEFYSKLTQFHKEVVRFNNDIQKALNQTNVFRCISSITIHFDSSLEKLKYWNDVTEFNAIHQAWASSGREMPTAEFAEGLKRIVSHWEVREGIRAERRKLINIRGDVVENGNPKIFHTTADLEKLSSNGLSYLILCTIFVAFIRKIRGDANVQITWAVDELLDLDSRNIHDLLNMLQQNGICLFSACPEANLDILVQFAKLYRVQRTANYPEIVEFVVDMGDENV
ncbi:MAG: ATP-binding protein [Pseudomonadota bacterium]